MYGSTSMVLLLLLSLLCNVNAGSRAPKRRIATNRRDTRQSTRVRGEDYNYCYII